MKCNIEYVGKKRTGKPQYYCTTHKSYASDKDGNVLDECLWEHKEIFNNRFDINDKKVESITVIYENILESVIPKIYINDEEYNGVFEYKDSLLTYKDFGGVMLSKLNNVPLEDVKCSRCGKTHSDNGRFAYTPHRTHLCLYCGHLFRVSERNVGSELNLIYNIPSIKLNDAVVEVGDSCSIRYELLNGKMFVNDSEVNRVIFKDKEENLLEFLNSILENEF